MSRQKEDRFRRQGEIHFQIKQIFYFFINYSNGIAKRVSYYGIFVIAISFVSLRRGACSLCASMLSVKLFCFFFYKTLCSIPEYRTTVVRLDKDFGFISTTKRQSLLNEKSSSFHGLVVILYAMRVVNMENSKFRSQTASLKQTYYFFIFRPLKCFQIRPCQRATCYEGFIIMHSNSFGGVQNEVSLGLVRLDVRRVNKFSFVTLLTRYMVQTPYVSCKITHRKRSVLRTIISHLSMTVDCIIKIYLYKMGRCRPINIV